MHFIITDDCGFNTQVTKDLGSIKEPASPESRRGERVTVSWNSFSNGNVPSETHVIHLGDLLHDQEAMLQRILFDWLGSLAKSYTAHDSPLPMVYSNLHAWWLLSLTEKNYATTPEFTTLMKLVILSKLCDKHEPTSIDYRGSDRRFEAVLREFATMRSCATNARGVSILERLRRRSEPLQAAIFWMKSARHAMRNLVRAIDFGTPQFALVGYLIPAPKDRLAQSPYWGNLPEHLAKSESLMWLYHRSDEMRLHPAREYCQARSAESPREVHRLFDDVITFRALHKTAKTFFSWRAARRKVVLRLAAITDCKLGLPVDELFANHMRDSLCGSRAISTILEAHVYDEIVRRLPKTKWLYLWENKPFEHSLVSAVARHSGQPSIGYAHSVIRRLDHRYFDETRTYVLDAARSRPAPTKYAVNSEIARISLETLGAPAAPIVEVEALRYAPLALTERLHPRRLLVVGDINQTESERLIELTASAMNGEPDMPELWFKPHPGSPSHVDMAGRFGFSVTTEPLLEIAPFLLLAVVGVAGAASVDLTLLGIPVITMLDARTPNLSPLSGIPGARFARSASQLMEFIRTPKLHHFSGDSLATRADPPLRWITLLKNTK